MAMRIFSALDLAVVGGGVAAYAGFLAAADLTPHVAFTLDAHWLSLAVAVASSHVLYAFVWFAPRRFAMACAWPPLSLLGAHAVSVFSALVFWFKFAQQCALLLVYAGRTPADALAAIRAASQAQLLLAAALLGGGQLLNASIYRAIGQDGVYYGFKLGRPVCALAARSSPRALRASVRAACRCRGARTSPSTSASDTRNTWAACSRSWV